MGKMDKHVMGKNTQTGYRIIGDATKKAAMARIVKGNRKRAAKKKTLGKKKYSPRQKKALRRAH